METGDARASRRPWRELRWRRPARAMRIALAAPARLLDTEQRARIEAEIHQQAELTSAYGLMLFAACGIAALGLLQSSVAVVIGAMLISPLMGPILSLGMSLARIEPRRFKKAAITLAIGAVLSIMAAVIIVWLVPLKDATPEIIGRTRPTLLDLIIAVLSGFVGAYLTINHKAGAIAGVAIATAVMPPLAVVGFGVATGNWAFAGGALLLFFTNVVAILAAVFVVARRYGFGPVERKGPAWEGWGLAAVVVLLSVPLALSLRDIVVEARETGRVRAAIAVVFRDAEPHITELDVRSERRQPVQVQGVIITRRYVSDAARRIARDLGDGAAVVIEQVVAANGLPKPDALSGSLSGRSLGAFGANALPEDRVRAMLSQVGEVLAVTRDDGGLAIDLKLSETASLEEYRAIETSLGRLTPSLIIRIRPPLHPFPVVRFGRGMSRLDDAGARTVDTIAWALMRWKAPGAAVEGHASPTRANATPRDLRLAEARARAVAERLTASGIAEVGVSGLVQESPAEGETQSWSATVVMAPAREPG